MKRQSSRGPLWTMMTDVGFQLIAVLLVLVQTYDEDLTKSKSQTVAATNAANEAEHERDTAQNEANRANDRADVAQDRADKAEEYAENAKGQANDALQRADDAEGRAKDAQDRARKAEQEGKEKDEALKKLRPGGPVDICILVDQTGSMEPHIERLKRALQSLFRWTPRLSSECRISIVGVRNGVVARFPLTAIRPPSEDGSQAKLMNFITSMKTVGSPIDHRPAFDEAFAILPDQNLVGRRQVIITLSDIGQSELDGQQGYSSAEMANARRIVSDVRTWALKGNRSVGCIYVGPDNQASLDRKWFQNLAQPAGQNFASDSAELFDVIFKSIDQK